MMYTCIYMYCVIHTRKRKEIAVSTTKLGMT